MAEIELRGLSGTNPLGFMAALGSHLAVERDSPTGTLRWTEGVVSYPVLDSVDSVDEVAHSALKLIQEWLVGPAFGSGVEPKLKLDPDEITHYLSRSRSAGDAGRIAMCLVAENSLDNGGRAKPTDFYFTAGQMKFVVMAREILGAVTLEELVADLSEPWKYRSEGPSLMWDVVDDRLYALSSTNPSSVKKSTNPGAEALAILGLSRFPCFRSTNGTATQGCSGGWKRGHFTWPLWNRPARSAAVASLLAHASNPAPTEPWMENQFLERCRQYSGWGVVRVIQSQIRRSDQGGYGTFGPPRVIWRRDE